MNTEEAFQAEGFLNKLMGLEIAHIRSEASEWFALAEDVNRELTGITYSGMQGAMTTSWDAKSIAIRILLKASGAFQGVVLLSERGMISESRTLTRCILECALHIAALAHDTENYIKILKDDFDASRSRQGKFLLAENLVTNDEARLRLEAAINQIGKVKPLDARNVAKLGPLTKYYLHYQRLSDDSVHLTARSLHRYIDDSLKNVWQYKIGPGDGGEVSATLHYSVMAAIAVGVGVTDIIREARLASKFGHLVERFERMLPVSII